MIPIPAWLAKLTWASFNSFLRQVAAITGLVVTVGNYDHLGGTPRAIIMAISGSILTAEHYANAINPATPPQSTNTPPTPSS
jgi:hypothetical protein